MVSVLAFYSDDMSSNPVEIYNFSVKLYLKSTKIIKTRPGLAHLKKQTINLVVLIWQISYNLVNFYKIKTALKQKMFFYLTLS